MTNPTPQEIEAAIEVWKDVIEAPDLYEASNLGRVRSKPHTFVSSRRTGRISRNFGKMKKLSNDGNGYKHAAFIIKGKRKLIGISRIVWAAFNGPIPAGLFINHINGIIYDNRLSNLEAVTPRENSIHAVRTGLSNMIGGTKTLSDADVLAIRTFYVPGVVSILVKIFDRAPDNLRKIARGEMYAWVDTRAKLAEMLKGEIVPDEAIESLEPPGKGKDGIGWCPRGIDDDPGKDFWRKK